MTDLSRISIVGVLEHGTRRDVYGRYNHRKSLEEIN
jgi:hypothetical protein